MGIVSTSYASGVLEMKVICKPTLLWGGVNGMVVDKNFKVFNLLLITNDGALTSLSITSTNTTKVITSKGMISKHVSPIMGLIVWW
jgi:hypothetical protein